MIDTQTFFQASVSCVLAGLLALSMLSLAARLWPSLAQTRSVWLMAQAIAAGVFVLVLLPPSAQLRLVPTIEVAHTASVVPALDDGAMDFDAASSLFDRLAEGWLWLYGAGLGAALLRQARAQWLLRRLLASAHRIDSAAPLPIYETEAAVPPMLVASSLLLPAQLQALSEQQRALIIEHELTHWRRRDPLWLVASIVLQTVFWFNPAMRMLGQRLHGALELSCDAEVLRGQAAAQRHAYAAALVGQWKMQAGALAFGGATVGERIALIRNNSAAAANLAGRIGVALALAVLLAGSVMLQPAFAWLPEPKPAVALALANPLEHARITSKYGVVSPLRPKGHRGVDYAARKGTPVLASADGTVTASTDLFENQAKFGKVVTIEHGGKITTMYAHLDSRAVNPGQHVTRGQVIGLSGATGKTTGPHLHFETWRDGVIVDPQSLLTQD
ncbi:MAG: M23/M56 family metallopeptidase [Pseudomonadota bacterium]